MFRPFFSGDVASCPELYAALILPFTTMWRKCNSWQMLITLKSHIDSWKGAILVSLQACLQDRRVCVVYMEMVESGSSSQGGGYMSKEFKEWIKQGNGYAMGLLPSTDWIGPMRLEDVELPEGAPAEYHYDFNDIWRRYCLQINYTNGMDVDTYPGPSMEAETGPLDLSIPKEELEGFWRKQYELRIELAEFAINQYNEESNFFKYELVKIEKANFRLSGYSEFFMTVKVRNVTLGTVVETFHIHVGSQHGDLHKEVFSCLPKGGALSSRSVWKRKRNRLERESGTSGT